METKVVNLRKSSYDVYIGRGSIFGNPFHIGKDGTREEVINRYAEWVLTQPQILRAIPDLEGKTLGCFCKPAACHGDVLLELLEKIKASKLKI